MYASVLKVKIKLDKLDEAVRIYSESQASHTQTGAGAKGFLMLVDRDSGEALAIGLWDSEAAAHKFETKELHRDWGPLHLNVVMHDELATAFPAGDSSGALPAYESVIARFAGCFAGQPEKSVYEVGATAGHLDVLQSASTA
ncbi:MAG TPA: hypothetical protein VK131_03450 [Candidatus Acidoferrales bacterium]|nr:hypothetical protein [Candidatus Acidoferrales bacterium]